jgi:acyl-CoA thioester hydrolase
MERARTEWLRSLGVEQDVLLYEQRRLFVVIETSCEFLVPAKFNDEIVATAALSDLSRATFSMEQNIFRNNLDGELLCRGTTKAAFLNADTLRPIRVPADLFEDSKS